MEFSLKTNLAIKLHCVVYVKNKVAITTKYARDGSKAFIIV